MAFSGGESALCLCLLLPLIACALSPPTLTSTTSPDHGGTLTLVCEVRGDQDTLQSIEVGRGHAQSGSYISSASLGIITYNNQIRTYSNNYNIGIDGHLDGAVPGSSYLQVVIHSVGCSYDGAFYCKLSTPTGSQAFANTTARICSGQTAQMAVRRPQLSDPTHFVVNCDITSNMTSLDNVTYVALHRTTGSHNDQQLVAFAKVTEDDGRARAFANFTQSHVQVSGGINQSDPLSSSLKVEFHGTCADDGKYTCTLVYTEEGVDEERLALAEGNVDTECDTNCLPITVAHGQGSTSHDPTTFHVSCGQSSSYRSSCSYSSLLSQEIVHIDSNFTQRQLAYFDRHNSNHSVVIHPDYWGRSVTADWQSSGGRSGVFRVDVRGGRCSDAGTYRCKMVYIRSDTHQPRVVISESTLSECAPGAVARVDLEGPGQERQFHCTADPALVHQLLSLEVSVVTSGHRTVLVFLSAYTNNAQPERQIDQGHFTYQGHIDPADPAASVLTLTSSKGSGVEQVTTSCKAVYLSGDGSGGVVESFVDQQFDLLW